MNWKSKFGFTDYFLLNKIRVWMSWNEGNKHITEDCDIMDYDKIIEQIGETSTWNLINLGLLWLPPIMAGVLLLQTSFTGYSSANIEILS